MQGVDGGRKKAPIHTEASERNAAASRQKESLSPHLQDREQQVAKTYARVNGRVKSGGENNRNTRRR